MISSHHVDDRSLRNGISASPGEIDYAIDEEDIAHLSGVADLDASEELSLGRYTFKCADTEDEHEQIHRLNYRTFVEEVGQYPDNGDDALVDKFHDKNRYFIAKVEGRVVGMIAVHDQPPFSVAKRLPDPTVLEQLDGSMLEVRLLAIEPSHRNSQLFRGLLWFLYEYGLTHGYNFLLISGIAGRTRMYERIGFAPLGPAVEDGDAAFVPMMVNLRRMPDNILRDASRIRERLVREVAKREYDVISLLPGPVHVAPSIRAAMGRRPISHRGDEFIERYENIRALLSEMSGGLRVAIMAGSGTLANEVVGATIAADTSLEHGVVLNNGEFGRRLAAQARRYDLNFESLEWEWGRKWDFAEIRATLEANPMINWIWGCHCETSMSLMNDIDQLFDLAAQFGARVCLDCVSSFGAVRTDLSRAHLATAVSGKAIGAMSGLAFIFAGHDALDRVTRDRIPQYLDLPSAIESQGPRFTVSSSVLEALDEAMRLWYDTPQKRQQKFENHAKLGEYVRRRLKSLGFVPLVDGPEAAPIISSFMPPQGISSRDFADMCESWGFEISALSNYLLERGMVQIATMGAVTRRDCARLFALLRNWMKEQSTLAAHVDA